MISWKFAERPNAARPCLLRLLCLSAILAGCSNDSGPSDYDRIRSAQQAFSAAVSEAGGTAELKPHALGNMRDQGWQIDLSNATITEELVRQIIEANAQDPVFRFSLSGSTITNEQLEQLDEGKVLQKVFILDLSDTGITDTGLNQLDHMHAITELALTGSKATKDAATRLGERKIASPQTPGPLKQQPRIRI